MLGCPRPAQVAPPDAAETPAPEDGGCASYASPVRSGTIPSSLPELSGLAASRLHPGIFYAHNDSGHAFVLFAIDVTGTVVGEWRLTGATPPDVEDVAVGPCAPDASSSCVFLADIGDNLKRRTEVAVLRIPEPSVIERGEPIAVERLAFHYPDGARDAEALLVHPVSGELGVISKEGASLGTLYVLDGLALDRTVTARKGQGLTLQRGEDRLTTAADVHPSGERLLIRTYGNVYEARAPDAQSLDALVAVALVEVPSAAQPQSEAIAYLHDGRGYLIGTEQAGEALLRVDCR